MTLALLGSRLEPSPRHCARLRIATPDRLAGSSHRDLPLCEFQREAHHVELAAF